MSLPRKKYAQLQYLEARAGTWADNQAALNLSIEQAVAVATSTEAARAAYDDYQQKRQEAKNAHVTWLGAIAGAVDNGRSALRTINTTAKNSADPSAIYALASVAPPKPREPLGPPPVPTDLRIVLDTEGRANLAWEGTRLGGTVFTVQRRTTSTTGQTGPWATLVTVSERAFVDQATPSGFASVGYRVRAERVGGPSAFSLPVTLPLGAGGNQQGIAGAIGPVETSGKEAG
ncbi:MAG: hypothetical protein KIT54_02995 [Phycisphaeraceae bacterium]|nr:hypothetical protein [Phycisphaeraceae bacterium]